jgi:acyl carrier protein
MVAADERPRAKAPCGAAADSAAAAAVLAAVTEIVREVCEDPSIRLTPETETDAIPDWRDLTGVGIAVEAECRFDVLFQAPEIVALRTVGDLVALIARKRASVDA